MLSSDITDWHTNVGMLPSEVTDFLRLIGGIFGRSMLNVGGGKNGGMTGLRVDPSAATGGLRLP